jgi:hypothetical protein
MLRPKWATGTPKERFDRVAYHEAGHAVLAAFHDLVILEVRLAPRGRVLFDSWIRDPWVACLVFLASSAAEERAFGDIDEAGCNTDRECAIAAAIEIGGIDAYGVVVDEARSLVRFLVDLHWDDIEHVALTLLASPDGVLQGDSFIPTRKLVAV